ncbi:hypothetical protein QZH41_020375, partial [Actinostola sp. cb2023]
MYLRLQSVTTTSDLGETISDCSTGSSTFLQDAETVDSCCSLSPATSYEHANDDDLEPAKEEKREELPSIPENPPKVYVKELKVMNIQKKVESKLRHESKKKEDYEYIIEVSWSDGTADKIHKSYEEMFDFQCKLRKMYPTKIDENGQPWKLPFLPGRIRIFNKSEHKGERTPIPDISDYTRVQPVPMAYPVQGAACTYNAYPVQQLLKLTDKEFEKLGMTTGARRKLRVNLEILSYSPRNTQKLPRKRGCFSSDGQRMLDILPVMTKDFNSLSSITSPCTVKNGYLCMDSSSETDFIRTLSESDSGSDCGSDTLSDIYPPVSIPIIYPPVSIPIRYPAVRIPMIYLPVNSFPSIKPDGCRLSCYNCGSLGHVGGQCMAPNMEKRLNYGETLWLLCLDCISEKKGVQSFL